LAQQQQALQVQLELEQQLGQQVLQELPTTNVGKISRRELRAKLAEIFG